LIYGLKIKDLGLAGKEIFKSAVGSGQSAVGSRRSAVGNWWSECLEFGILEKVYYLINRRGIRVYSKEADAWNSDTYFPAPSAKPLFSLWLMSFKTTSE
jgi:hypothetical protein